MKHDKLRYRKNYKLIGDEIKTFYSKILNSSIRKLLEDNMPNVEMSFPEYIRDIILADTLKSVERVVCNSCSLREAEAFEYVVYLLYDDNERMSFWDWKCVQDIQNQLTPLKGCLREAFPYSEDVFGAFQMVNILSGFAQNDLADEYFDIMYELSMCVTYADDEVSNFESLWIETLNFYKPIIHSRAQITEMSRESNVVSEEMEAEDDFRDDINTFDEDIETEEIEAEEDEEDEEDEYANPIEKLKELIGLEPVKSDVKSLKNLLYMQKLRASKGLKTAKVSYHCVFMGNPGTGKTTVARILARIYRDLGILKKGHLVETDRSGLVADYVGQTATKTNAIIDKALDGVLFIDEAYALAQGGSQDYGREAISTLLKRMEDDRKRLVVILAGYSKEMEEFISSNSGLQSRFSRYILFPDYEVNELCDIFRLFLKQNDYIITDDAMKKVMEVITDAFNNKDYKFGNARYVRNLFESIITHQANRLADQKQISKKDLTKIIELDI